MSFELMKMMISLIKLQFIWYLINAKLGQIFDSVPISKLVYFLP